MATLHRLSYVETGRTPHWRAAAWAGIAAGLVFLLLEMLLTGLASGAWWGPPRMIAAMVLGREVLPPPADFDFAVAVAALVVHLFLAVIYGLLAGALVYRLETGWAVLAGAIFGLALYWINFYGFSAVFPWFALARNAISIVAHIAFGAVAAWAYKGLALRQIRHEGGLPGE